MCKPIKNFNLLLFVNNATFLLRNLFFTYATPQIFCFTGFGYCGKLYKPFNKTIKNFKNGAY